MFRRLTIWGPVFAVASACVDPIAFDVPPPADLLVIDGSITDAPGPYLVKISKGRALDATTSKDVPVSGAVVRLYDDLGAMEVFSESSPGNYSTGSVIRGTIGRTYHISLTMPDGSVLESEPETILPAGEVQDIRYEFESRMSDQGFGLVPADVFNIFIDAKAGTDNDDASYVRWRFTGTYKVETNPELRTVLSQGFYYKDPRPCSGYVVSPAEGGGVLEQQSPCTCCTCWVKLYEEKPQLSNLQLVADGQFSNVKVGEVLISPETFFDKVLVEVEQMSISKSAYDYFRIMRMQKEGADDLFQPAQGRLRGNIRATNTDHAVVGLFWAASVKRKSVYILKSDVPYPLTPMNFTPESCATAFENSSTTKPANWND